MPFSPAADRPDSSAPAFLANRPTRLALELVINIKSRGRWEVFLGAKTLADCLLRPGVVDFQGSSWSWPSVVPCHIPGQTSASMIRLSDLIRLANPGGPMLVPAGPDASGVLLIDYDDRQAWAVLSGRRALALEPHAWAGDSADPRHGWAAKLIKAGRLPSAADPVARQSYPLPTAPARLSAPLGWLEGQAYFAWARAHPGADPLDPRQTPAGNDRFFFPLAVPGWTFTETQPDPTRALDAVADRLHPGELRAWTHWMARLDPAAPSRFHARCLEAAWPATSAAPRNRF